MSLKLCDEKDFEKKSYDEKSEVSHGIYIKQEPNGNSAHSLVSVIKNSQVKFEQVKCEIPEDASQTKHVLPEFWFPEEKCDTDKVNCLQSEITIKVEFNSDDGESLHSSDEKLMKEEYKLEQTYFDNPDFVEIKLEEKNGLYNCHECDYQTTSKIYMRKHILRQDRNTKRLNCSHCNYQTFRKAHLKLHLKNNCLSDKLKNNDASKFKELLEQNIKRLKCVYCDYCTTVRRNMRRHVLKHDPNAKKVKCLHCDYETLIKCNLKNHILTHNQNAEKFKCPHCEHQTVRHYDLKRHMQKHTVNGQHLNCPHCNYRTYQEWLLKQHLRMHDPDSKKYTCPHCDYWTLYRSNLKRHLIKHNPIAD